MVIRRWTTLFSSIVTVIAAAIICGVDAASNFNKPHSHTGKVTPFKPGDPNVKLDGKAKGILKSGKPYQVSWYQYNIEVYRFPSCERRFKFMHECHILY